MVFVVTRYLVIPDRRTSHFYQKNSREPSFGRHPFSMISNRNRLKFEHKYEVRSKLMIMMMMIIIIIIIIIIMIIIIILLL